MRRGRMVRKSKASCGVRVFWAVGSGSGSIPENRGRILRVQSVLYMIPPDTEKFPRTTIGRKLKAVNEQNLVYLEAVHRFPWWVLSFAHPHDASKEETLPNSKASGSPKS